MTLFYFILFTYLFIYFCAEMSKNILFFGAWSIHAAQRSPIAIENGNQSIPENLVKTPAYVVRRRYRRWGRGEKFSRVEKRAQTYTLLFLLTQSLPF